VEFRGCYIAVFSKEKAYVMSMVLVARHKNDNMVLQRGRQIMAAASSPTSTTYMESKAS
jgi:hypothetical protein